MGDSDNIPREVLRWLQSLDLAYSIKNPRRDFANGFLVAEIFYRYYVKIIQIHSYDNGISLPNRKANWSLLRKFFKRYKVPITEEEVDDVMYSRPGKVVQVIKKIYSFLTQREVQEKVKPRSNLPAPPFMKPTAAQAIRNTLGRGASQIKDRTKKQGAVQEALNKHNEMLADTRTIDANRKTGVLNTSKVLKGESRKIVQEKERPKVLVKKVQVKSVDRSIAQLRAKQAASNNHTSVLQSAPRDFGHVRSGSNMPTESAEKIFDKAVSFVLGPENASVLDTNRQDVAVAFLENVDSAQPINDALAERIVRDAFGSQVSAAANVAMQDPMQFHRAFHLLSLPLRLRTGPVFEAACDVLRAFGSECVARHAPSAKSLFLDLSLGSVIRIAGNLGYTQLINVVNVCLSFVGKSWIHRLELVKCMRDVLLSNNDAVLVRVMLALAEAAVSNDAPPQEMVDLSVLCCQGGLTAQGDVSLQQTAIQLLRHVAIWSARGVKPSIIKPGQPEAIEEDRSSLKAVTDMLPALMTALEKTASSELEDDFLRTSAVLLQVLEANEGADEVEAKLWPLINITQGGDELKAKRLGMVVPYAVERGIEEMLKLDAPVLMKLLNDPDAGLHKVWNPAEAARAVADLVITQKQENLTSNQMSLIASIASHAAALGRVAGPDMLQSWSKVLDSVGKYIFVALTDETLVEKAVEFLSVFLLSQGVGALRLNILERKHLVSSMMLLFRDGDIFCQDAVCNMLAAALQPSGNEAAADVAAFINSIEQYIAQPSEGVQRLLEEARLFDEEANNAP